MAEVQIQNLSHRHKEIADWLLVNPHIKNLQTLCDKLNISRSWLSIVMQSDVFKEYFDKRRHDYEQTLQGRLAVRQLDIALKALDKLDDIIASDEVDDRLIFDIANKTAINCGFGGTRNKTTVIEERTREVSRSVDPTTLAHAREMIRLTTRTEYAQLPPPKPD